MIKKVEMYTVVCDGCGRDVGNDQEYSCWNDESSAEENAMNSGWVEHNDEHYCPDCYEYDDNDELILKVKTETK